MVEPRESYEVCVGGGGGTTHSSFVAEFLRIAIGFRAYFNAGPQGRAKLLKHHKLF